MKTNADIASQSRAFYRRLYGGGMFLPPHHTNICKIFIAHVRPITFKLGNFTKLKALFPVVFTKYFLTGHCQKLKNTWKGIFFTGKKVI